MEDKLVQRLNEIVDDVETRHLNDPVKMELLYEMANLLMTDESATINFLKMQSIYHERIIYWMTSFFDDIACRFSSDEMAEAMTSLLTRYPHDAILKNDVDMAIRIIDNTKKMLSLNDDSSRNST